MKTSFHPAIAQWFRDHFAKPTEAQAQAWPLIQLGKNVLIAAPTGSGKTLAAFLAAIDGLIRQGLRSPLSDETTVVYVSPLKALSNDIQRNLAVPLSGIRAKLEALGLPDVDIRVFVRTGDTPQKERMLMRRRPPHIVVTTPESLYILLGSASGRKMLATTRTIIVDEIHAVAGNKRGSHLALSIERLEALTQGRLTRIGLSATQKPIDEIANFLVGASKAGKPRTCAIVDTGHVRLRDLAIEVPSSPLQAVMSNEVWQQVYARIAQLAAEHRTTLVFVNTRRMSERAARHLSELLGVTEVMSHHGSMAKERRLDAEQRLKHGKLKVLVATASLELGIDIGDVDLVCQLGSPRSIAAFLQRAGRASHQVDGVPKARLFPLSRDDLVECAALLDAVRRGELDRLHVPRAPLDVLAQQITAEVAANESSESALFDLVRQAYPYRDLEYENFMAVVRMLSEGFNTRVGQRAALLHRDAVNGMLRGRRGASLTALTSGGAIPDTADYDVVLEPSGQLVGTVNEDFAVESLSGDIFQLGNMSYRIQRIESGRVRVEDAHGQAPTIPFWLGEAPGRADELSQAVSRLRNEVIASIDASGDLSATLEHLANEIATGPAAALQLVEYLSSARMALGTLPTQQTIVLERFFDESGGMQLVIHSPFGSRINRAWGLALRKRFCVKFNFELQAAATEDAIVLSLSTSHSFELASVARYLNSSTVRDVLIQAMLTAPMFAARWRWVAGTSLALPRFRGGKKVPAPLQRMRAEDLMAAVFPDQIACAENLVGDREVPNHPLVQQAIHDCLHDAMDIEGLERLLRDIETGAIEVIARDLTMPSPLALEILTARPYAFLDDAPLEERRTQAVISRRWLDDASAQRLGSLNIEAIERVRAEAWPQAETADELHDALLAIGFLTTVEIERQPAWAALLQALTDGGRATYLCVSIQPDTTQEDKRSRIWVAAERLPLLLSIFDNAVPAPPITVPAEFMRQLWTRESALVEIARSRLGGMGPVTLDAFTDSLCVGRTDVSLALATLAAEGVAMSGLFTPGVLEQEWCDRALLARIHRYTVTHLRQEIEPVATQAFMRFLFQWQHTMPNDRRQGPDALEAVIAQLQGFEAPAAAWESELLPVRLADYDFTWLDDLCLSGRVVWTRLTAAGSTPSKGQAGPIRTTPVALTPRRFAPLWNQATAASGEAGTPRSSRAQVVADFLREHGAAFYDEIVDGTGLLRTQVEAALAELVVLGVASSDSFAGLRALLTPSEKRKPLGDAGGRKRHRRAIFDIADSGRWALQKRTASASRSEPVAIGATQPVLEHIVQTLLRRYGVVFWRMLHREGTWLPPWRDLLRVLRRLEARGEIRGGRFVAGVSGEQFALPEAVELLRKTRRLPAAGEFVSVSGADPLNLVGVILPGAKVSALAGNRVLYLDGIAVATLVGGQIEWRETLTPEQSNIAEDLLIRRRAGAPMLAYLR